MPKATRLGILAAGCFAIALNPCRIGSARDFTYAGRGGGLQDAQREAFLRVYAKVAGQSFMEDVYSGGMGKFLAMKSTGDVSWDVVNVESDVLQTGCEEGMFLKIDYARLGVPRDRFVKGAAAECGVGSYVYAFVIAYDGGSISHGPRTLADFWNTNKWPGRRGLPKGPLFNLEFALLADGVPSPDVYKTLATEAGIARAFAKLDKIKRQVVWWEAPAQTPGLLDAGTVSMIFAPSARISTAVKAGKKFKLVFEPGMVGIDYWAIINGSPRVEAAYEFLRIGTDPAAQASFSNIFPDAPTIKAADALVSRETRPMLPVGEATGALNLSAPEAVAFWVDQADRLNEQWNAWLAR
jgi:putative spermidine/putrescine transport system substrate-binding protein